MIEDRFKDAPFFEKSKKELIYVIGLGGIGSNAMYNLYKTIPATYTLFDRDIVEEHNIGTQFYGQGDLGKNKAMSIYNRLYTFKNGDLRFINQHWVCEYNPIMLVCVDNMKIRKEAFEVWCRGDNKELYIDGRMRANFYEVFAVQNNKTQIEEYKKTLFDDSEVDHGPCTFQQTAYVGMMIGAKITQIVVNYLTNKYADTDICKVPFRVSELTELFYYELK